VQTMALRILGGIVKGLKGGKPHHFRAKR